MKFKEPTSWQDLADLWQTAAYDLRSQCKGQEMPESLRFVREADFRFREKGEDKDRTISAENLLELLIERNLIKQARHAALCPVARTHPSWDPRCTCWSKKLYAQLERFKLENP